MALINLRNALMAGKRLPYDAEVEYLESDGSSFIDTGVFGTNNTRIVVSIHTVSAQGYNAPFGSRRSTSSDRLDCLFAGDGTSGYCGYGSWATNVVSFSGTSLGDNTLDLNLGSLTINGNYKGSAQFDSFTTPTTIKLFCNETNGVQSQFFSGYMYFCQIYQNGVLVRDYIPVRKKTVGYLYDRVSGKLFGNAGTGDFLYGADVVPVEHLESSGTQYIDTGVTPQLTGVYKLNFTPSVASPIPWGCLNFTEVSGYGRYFATSGKGNYPRSVGVNYLIEVNGVSKKVIVNGNDETPDYSFITTAKGNCWLFGRSDTGALGSLKIYGASFTDAQGTLVRDFIPVRVGTDATSWDGAMMDTLTRRIYRNAGTGAFSYGNDLKYPIPAE